VAIRLCILLVAKKTANIFKAHFLLSSDHQHSYSAELFAAQFSKRHHDKIVFASTARFDL
jgi:hypothetical protein